MAKQTSTNIAWMDLELTGIDIQRDRILEVTCLITDENLKIISEELHIVIHETDQVLQNMNEWSMEHHAKSGLTAECRASNVTLENAEQSILRFLQKYIPEFSCPLAGNSIYMDRLFLAKHMPLVHNYLHYRIIDVSSVKELVRRWCPAVDKALPNKQYGHRSSDDIKESIQELQYYKTHIFQSQSIKEINTN